MALRDHLRGNGVAIALGALAVAIAASGTAVAASIARTSIADPVNTKQVVRVDRNGRMLVNTPAQAAPKVTVNAPVPVAYVSYSTFRSSSTGTMDLFLTSPTTATIAITNITIAAAASNAQNYTAAIIQVPVESNGQCSTSSELRSVNVQILRPGQNVVADYSTPVIVTPFQPGQAYCLDVYLNREANTAPGQADLAWADFHAYLTSGTSKNLTPSVRRSANGKRLVAPK